MARHAVLPAAVEPPPPEETGFVLTERQRQALRIFAGEKIKHVMLYGGSRSGKTFLAIRAIIVRALAAENSRHAVMRLRFNHVKNSIVLDTFPKVMRLCFPGVQYKLDKSDWYVKFPNKAEIWFGGLDDKDRTEKILGMEFVTIFLNECSQISYYARNLIMTRLAQKVKVMVDGLEIYMRRFMIYDCNPPSQAHWTYIVFRRLIDPDTKQPLNGQEYACIQMNPKDNSDNLPDEYFATLDSLPARMRKRFRDGDFADITENALWTSELIDANRCEELPDMQRVVVAIDPSGAGDENNSQNDEIGIIVAGLGVDGRGYLLEDVTVKAGPQTWGNIAVTAYDRHAADLIVGETNYGGEMVKFVIKSQNPDVPFKKVTASRGKVVRAEPISALTEQGKIRFAGQFNDLEDELCAMTTAGFIGDKKSPNRADAMVWAFTELFPGIAKKERQQNKGKPKLSTGRSGGGSAWMGI